MKTTGKDILFIVLAGGAAYAMYKLFTGGAQVIEATKETAARGWDYATIDQGDIDTIKSSAQEFWDTVTFGLFADEPEPGTVEVAMNGLGARAALPSRLLGQNDFIQRGFLELNPFSGKYRLTIRGRDYIRAKSGHDERVINAEVIS